MEQNPYWIVLGDIHSDTGNLQKVPGLKEAAGVIITGDLTIMGGVKEAKPVFKAIHSFNTRIFAQLGNMDKPEITDWLREKGVNIHAQYRALEYGKGAAPALIGLGASSFTPFNTPSEYSEEQLNAWLKLAYLSYEREHLSKLGHSPLLVLSSHSPPFGTSCDLLTNGAHVGSTAVRDFIERCQPDICLCGHIHEAVGHDMIGKTLVINPGPLMLGGYIKMTLITNRLYAEVLQV